MGYMCHHAIVVTSSDRARLDELRLKVLEIATRISSCGLPSEANGSRVSPVVESCVNGYASFFVAPDGSKEGWDASHSGDIQRIAIVALLRSYEWSDGSSPFDWVEVQYGDDALQTVVVHDSDERRRKA